MVTGSGALAPHLSRHLAGLGVCLLSLLYLGHVVAVRNWGSPMSQAIVLAALQQLPKLAVKGRREWLLGLFAGFVIYRLGWSAACADQYCLSDWWLAWVGFGGGSLSLLLGAAVSRAYRIPLSSDLLFGVVLGGHGPQGATLPHDPSLGERRPASTSIPPRHRPTLILFVIDSARAQNFSCYGYFRQTSPCLDVLLESGACRVPLAISSGAASETGLWAIFSSRRVRHQATNALCLHDLLKAAGYSVRIFGSGVHRYYRGLEWLYGDNCDTFRHLLHDPQLVQCAQSLPPASQQGDLLFFFLMSAHMAAMSEPPVFWTPAQNRASRTGRTPLTRDQRMCYLNHYDNGIREADRVIGEVLDALEPKGYLQNARVIVTADHGEQVFERPQEEACGHGLNLLQEDIHIPLLYWNTRGGVGAPSVLADHTDIAPTLLAELGIEAPSSWQGRSIFTKPGRSSTHVEHVHHHLGEPPLHMEAFLCRTQEGIYKTIRHRQRGKPPEEFTFCLSTDPGERQNLKGMLEPELRAQLESIVRQYSEQPAIALNTIWGYLGLTDLQAPA